MFIRLETSARKLSLPPVLKFESETRARVFGPTAVFRYSLLYIESTFFNFSTKLLRSLGNSPLAILSFSILAFSFNIFILSLASKFSIFACPFMMASADDVYLLPDVLLPVYPITLARLFLNF